MILYNHCIDKEETSEAITILSSGVNDMKNMKVSQKLYLGFGAVIILTVLLAVFAIYAIITVDKKYTHQMEYADKRLIAVHQAKEHMLLSRRATSHMGVFSGLEGTEATLRALSDSAVKSIADAKVSLDEFIVLLQTDDLFTEEEKNSGIAIAKNIESLAEQYQNKVVLPVSEANINGQREEVVVIAGQFAGISEDLFGSVDELIELATGTTQAFGDETTVFADRLAKILVVLTVVVILISLCFAAVIPRSISAPLSVLTGFMQRAGSTGNITLRKEDMANINEYSQRRDEIGQCIAATAGFVQHLSKISEELNDIANGDLTDDMKTLSEHDVMGNSLRMMHKKLNEMFRSISNASDQVSVGSRQIAEGAQYLAQGATQQAASVEELSGSIDELAQKTKRNAEVANQAEQLANMIIGSAEKGSMQMGEMMSAVKDINDASQSIDKIIKNINDIAFQTNILALNAAVEAARAGKHGKGFAVVADEVRNLAAKSAEAVTETSNMIQNSKEKAELGARIAEDTAASLTEIVSGINESSRLIGEIAESSEEQSVGIGQINAGMDQVSQVIQQNSATAEESAAASQEMSEQSNLLQQLVSQFRIER